jgi:hypothetical protein
MQPGSGKQRREKPEPHRRRWQAGKWTDGEDYESERKVRTSVKQEGVGTGSKVVQQSVSATMDRSQRRVKAGVKEDVIAGACR